MRKLVVSEDARSIGGGGEAQNRTAECSVLLQPHDDIDINYQHISTLAIWNSDCIV